MQPIQLFLVIHCLKQEAFQNQYLMHIKQEEKIKMAYVPVPKDLTQVKTKLVFNLTKRQLIFFSLAAAVGVPLYFLLRKRIDSGIAAILMVTVMSFWQPCMKKMDSLLKK